MILKQENGTAAVEIWNTAWKVAWKQGISFNNLSGITIHNRSAHIIFVGPNISAHSDEVCHSDILLYYVFVYIWQKNLWKMKP